MVLGFNHNIKHKGKVFHVQTEDSGVETPHIITLLYVGGNIMNRVKTSYADIIKVDDLESVVRDLMQEQHKTMIRKLISGDFDVPSKVEEPLPQEKELTKKEEKEQFGGDILSDKGLDEVILDFLSAGTINDD